MTHFEYNANPPYPTNKEDNYFMRGVCYLLIEDMNRRINFKEDELFFEVNYLPNGKTIGAIKTYLHTVYPMESHIFNYVVEYNTSFKITITSGKEYDLSGLKVSFIKTPERNFSTKV